MKYISFIFVALLMVACSNIQDGTSYVSKKTSEALTEGRNYREQASHANLLSQTDSVCKYIDGNGKQFDVRKKVVRSYYSSQLHKNTTEYFDCKDSIEL